jgi:hypothetical protein
MGYAFPIIIVPIVSGRLLDAVGDDRSARTLARVIQNSGAVDVLGVAAFPPSLPFYLRRPIPVATPTGLELTSNFIADYHAQLRQVPNSPLQAPDAWRRQIADCRTPLVLVTRAGDRTVRPVIDSLLPLLAVEGRYAAYGPCAASSVR